MARPSRFLRKCGSDLVRPPQLDILTFELLEPGPFVRRQAGPPAVVPLGLPHPVAQRLGRAPDLLGDQRDRGPLRGVVLGVLEHHPDGTTEKGLYVSYAPLGETTEKVIYVSYAP